MRARALYVASMAAMLAVTVWALATRTPERPETPSHYVAPDGDDSGPGTESEPWRTLQKAAEAAVPGSIVYVREGVYGERFDVRVSGSAAGGPVTFRSYPGEHVVLDGSGLEVPADASGMIAIDSQSYVTVRGFEIRGYRTSVSGHVPIGIYVTGTASHIRLLDNTVHDMGTDFRGRNGGDAHGIAVYGTSSLQPISDVVIEGNELFDLKLGSSESLVLNGNVQGFEVADNEVHDNNNIGIDVIGFEGTAQDPSVDQARNGVVRGNLVYNIDSYGNPAYGTDRSANGIYVDGGRDVLIEGNVIHDVNIGMEFASEHRGRATSHVTARNNLVYHATVIGLAIGGYDTRRGSTEDCVIVNNTFFENAEVELLVQFDTRDNVIANNIVSAGPAANFLENPYAENRGNVVDSNIYFSPVGDEGTWQWKGIRYPDFETYRDATGNDRHSVFADPAFVDPESGDFGLEDGSPAIDAGAYVPSAGAVDLEGAERMANGVLDAGAYEHPAPPPSPTPSISGPVEYASDLEWASADNGWGPVERDTSNAERPRGDGIRMSLNGTTFDKGIGAHAPSVVRLDLDGRCTAFLADVGVDDEVGDRGSVAFQVRGDGDVLVETGVVRGTQAAVPIYADVTGVSALELVVRSGGDGVGWDHADWGNARLACGA